LAASARVATDPVIIEDHPSTLTILTVHVGDISRLVAGFLCKLATSAIREPLIAG
jgi:hypothetical protein